jgi:hypothetical protein
MPGFVERRRSVRVQVTSDRLLPSGLRDISIGGLSIALSQAVAVDTVRDFSFTLGNGEAVVLRGRVAHTHPELQTDGRPVYVTGVEFLADVTDHDTTEPLELAS